VVRALKDIRGCLVDGCCARAGSRIRLLSCVKAQRIEAKGLYLAHVVTARA